MADKLEVIKILSLMEKENLVCFKKFADLSFDEKFLNEIYFAIKENKILDAIYNDKEREIKPYGVIYLDKIYLVGKEDKKGNDFYTYNLSKFLKLNKSENEFIKEKFDINQFANHSFGIYRGEKYTVELLFSSNVKEKVLNKIFHPTQKINLNDNGSILVTFEASGDVEILREIFKWKNDCKILSPKKLIDEYKKVLEEIIKIYN